MTVHVTIPADVHQVDHTGFVWTYLDEADEPDRVAPHSIVVAGDVHDPFLARVVDIVDGWSHRKIVHLEVIGVPEQVADELRHAGVIDT